MLVLFAKAGIAAAVFNFSNNLFIYDGIQFPSSNFINVPDLNISNCGPSTTRTVTYTYEGVYPTIYPASTTPPYNAGSYTIRATINGGACDLEFSAPYSYVIRPANLIITANNVNRPYGGAILSVLSGSVSFTTSGLKNNEEIGSVTILYATGLGSGNEITSPVATYVGVVAVNSPTGGTFTASNYDIAYAPGNIVVTKKPITVTVDPNQTKEYGATNPATYTYGVSPAITGLAPLNGILTRVAGETVGLWAIEQNDLTTANNANYTINYIGNNFTITKKLLTVIATPSQTKVYGTADPTSYAYTLSAPLLGSDVFAGGLTRVSGEIVGLYAINKGSLSNANYDIDFVGSNFTITKASLSITGITGANKIYDGTTNVTINGTASYVGLVPSDAGLAVTGTPSFNFDNKNKGIAKPITVSGFTAPSANYTLTQPTGLTGDITPKTAIINIVANDKSFDGSTAATVVPSSPSFIAGDIVNINYTAAEFDSKDPGTNKTVTVTGINLGGVDAFNYNLTNTTATAIANITGAITSSIRPFVLPNAFTPNGDTKNTEFKFIVNDPSKITLRLFQIFNRNGKLMFSTNDISKGWDGRYNGVIQDMGVYFVKYRIDINGAPSSVDTVPFYLLK
jgi:gliding motility-associated-like protein